MARSYAKLKSSVWRDAEWTSLPATEQRLYLLLISQPEITNCGVLPYLPTKWARMAPDTPQELVDAALARLEQQRFVVIDDVTCELLVRTYVKHDQVLEQPKIAAAARRNFEHVQSTRIRVALATEYPEAFVLEPHEQAKVEDYAEGLAKPSAEATGKGTENPPRARAGGHPPLQPPTAPSPEDLHQQQQPAADAAAGDQDHRARRLREAGWRTHQVPTTDDDLNRAVAWYDYALLQPDVRNPAGLAYDGFRDGGWPSTSQAIDLEAKAAEREARLRDALTEAEQLAPTWQPTPDHETFGETLDAIAAKHRVKLAWEDQQRLYDLHDQAVRAAEAGAEVARARVSPTPEPQVRLAKGGTA